MLYRILKLEKLGRICNYHRNAPLTSRSRSFFIGVALCSKTLKKCRGGALSGAGGDCSQSATKADAETVLVISLSE